MQVNDIDSSDSSMTQATSLGYLQYPPPAVFVSNVNPSERLSLAPELPLMSLPLFVPSSTIDDSRLEVQQTIQHTGSSSMHIDSSASIQFQTDSNAAEQNNSMVSPMETFPLVTPDCNPDVEGTTNSSFLNTMGFGTCDLRVDAMETDEVQPVGRSYDGSSTNLNGVNGNGVSEHSQNRLEFTELEQLQQILPRRDHAYWELPFLQGWLIGQSQAGLPSMTSLHGGNLGHSAQFVDSSMLTSHRSTHNVEAATASFARPGSTSLPGVSGRSGFQRHFPHLRFSVSESGDGPSSVTHDGSDANPIFNRIQSEISTSLAAAAAAELPCTVKLRVWSHDIRNPCAPLNGERCRLIIPHAVLCRYVEKMILLFDIFNFRNGSVC